MIPDGGPLLLTGFNACIERVVDERPPSSPEEVADPFFPEHRHLLRPLDRQLRGGTSDLWPDAIIVPTARSGTATRSGVRFAARLAVETGRPMVVLASHEAGSAGAVDVLGAQITVMVDEIPVRPDTLVLRTAHRPTALTKFSADELQISTAYRRGGDVVGEGKLRPNDVGRKRNLAVLLARSLGWSSVLFLDDDIFDDEDGSGVRHGCHERTLDISALAAATRALQDGELAVGWAARDFHDNSVLCHMAAQLGARQGQFIGGGALQVKIDELTPFFPSIYNEDWLFLLALLERRMTGICDVLDGGDVHQDEYAPFLRRRAASEELGDILGEGMLSLLHVDGHDQLLLPAFWRKALQERRSLKDRLREEVAAGDHGLKPQMLEVLDVLDYIHARLLNEENHWVSQFIAYVHAWRRDLQSWERRLRHELPSVARLVRSREFDAARTFGSCLHPDDFLRRYARAAQGKGRTVLPVRA